MVRGVKAEESHALSDQLGTEAANGNLQTMSGESDSLSAFNPAQASACQRSERNFYIVCRVVSVR